MSIDDNVGDDTAPRDDLQPELELKPSGEIDKEALRYRQRVAEIMTTDVEWMARKQFYDLLKQVAVELPQMILLNSAEKRATLRLQTPNNKLASFSRTYGDPYASYFLPRTNEIYRYWATDSLGYGLGPLEKKYVPGSPEFIGVDAVKAEEAAGTLNGVYFDRMHAEPDLDSRGRDMLSDVGILSFRQMEMILDRLNEVIQKPESKQLLLETKAAIGVLAGK